METAPLGTEIYQRLHSTVELFKGNDWEDCDSFIRAIRARALWEGKQRDSAWMADFAAPQFSQKALLWHCRLPDDVRQDWSKLEIALLARWPFPEDDDEPQIRPTPAAALSPNRNHRDDYQLQGVLKVVRNGSKTSDYIKFSGVLGSLTSDVDEATHIRCNSLSSGTLLERMDHSCHSRLIVHWESSTPNIEEGSTDYAYISYFDPDTLNSSWSQASPFQCITCIWANGELIPAWTKKDNTRIPLSAFVRYGSLYLVADPEAYSEKHEDHKRAKLFIESLD